MSTIERTNGRRTPLKADTAQAPLLSCRGIDMAYGPVQILFGVDFDVADGEIVALLGTNGAGKSTLLKGICGLVRPTAGTVEFKGEDITKLSADVTTHRGMSLMPGGKGVFPTLTVAENLRLAAWLIRKDQDRVEAALAEVEALFPILKSRTGADGRQPLRRRAADAGPRRRADDPARAAHDRRAVPRPRPHHRRPAPRGRPGDPPSRHHHRDRRAVGQRGPQPGPAGRVHGEGRGALHRPDVRAPRAARHPPLGVHRRRLRGRRPQRRAGAARSARRAPASRPPSGPSRRTHRCSSSAPAW